MMKTFLMLVFCLLVVDLGRPLQQPTGEGTQTPPGSTSIGVSDEDDRIDPSVVINVSNLYGSDSSFPLPPRKGWTTIMQRFDGSVSFDRTSNEYKYGFGDLQGEFWLGNDAIYQMTSGGKYKLTIQMKAYGEWFKADYSNFRIDSEENKYALRVSGFSGNAGDSLTNTSVPFFNFHGDMSFSTPDVDNDRWSENCAEYYHCGWWFNECWFSCLTCNFDSNDFAWYSLKQGRLGAVRMMIKRT